MQGELYHYGVLGMKWGVHRANVHASKAAKLSTRAAAATNDAKREKLTARAQKQSSRSTALLNKHTRLAGSAETLHRVSNTSTGKLFAQSLVMGTYGTMKYHEARAKNKDRTESFIIALAHEGINRLTDGITSIVEPRRSQEKRERRNSSIERKYTKYKNAGGF